MSYKNQITLIEDLPSLDDLEIPKSAGMSMIPPNESNKYQKFIRNNGYTTPNQSGMGPTGKHQNLKIIQPPPLEEPRQNFYFEPEEEYQPYNAQRVYENYDTPPLPLKQSHSHIDRITGHSCVDVAEHTINCLVCSKLYANNNTIFILIIVFLAVVNLLLLKRILETSG